MAPFVCLHLCLTLYLSLSCCLKIDNACSALVYGCVSWVCQVSDRKHSKQWWAEISMCGGVVSSFLPSVDMDMREIYFSWDPDPKGTIYISGGTQTMTFGQGRRSIFSVRPLPKHQPQPFRATGLSPFIVVKAVKISITDSLSFYSLTSFPVPPLDLTLSCSA